MVTGVRSFRLMMLDKRRILRWSQVVVNIVIIVLSMCVCLPLGYVWKYFDSSCLIGAEIHGRVLANKSTLLVDTTYTKWGDNDLCMYTIFMPVVVAAHGLIWTWFFVCLRIAFKEDGRDVYLTLPVVILHGILCICMVVSSFIITSGFQDWCNSATSNLNIKLECSALQDLSWSMFQTKHSFYTLYSMGEVSSWLLSVALAGQCVVTVYKAYCEWTWETIPSGPELDDEGTKQGHTSPFPFFDESTNGSISSISDTSGHVTGNLSEDSPSTRIRTMGSKSKKSQLV